VDAYEQAKWFGDDTALKTDFRRVDFGRRRRQKEIAERLVISRKTAGHHVEHIYAKTGTSNRALASLFAASHGLIDDSAADATPGPAGSPSTGSASR